MSIRTLKPGIDLVKAHRPYEIQCHRCETVFSFIEKDADKGEDEAGYVWLAVPCPSCGAICQTGHHDNPVGDQAAQPVSSEPPIELEAEPGG